MNTYRDIKYRFFIKVSGGNSGSIPIRDLMNCLWKESNTGSFTQLAFQSDDDFRNDCESNNGIIIVTDRALWHSIIRKIEERKAPLQFRKEKIERIEEKHGVTTITKTYKDFYKAKIARLDNILDKTSNVLYKFDRNIKVRYSFFNNSSIWIRLVVKDGNDDDSKIEKAQNELKYFNEIGLYNYDSAKENLEYNIRLQKQNYLDSKTLGHGVHVTPVLYGDEAESLNILRDNNIKIE